MGITTLDAIQTLAKHYSPFIHLPADALAQLDGPMRLFELAPGEEIRIRARGAEGYLYLIGGEATVATDQESRRHSAGDDRKLPITVPAPPSRLTVTAETDAVLCQCESEDLDLLMSWHGLAGGDDLLTNSTARARFRKVRHSCLALRQLPLDCVERTLAQMELMPVSAGQDIVVQGEEGDAFYIMLEGEAEVWSQGLYDDEQLLVNRLGAGDAFGEEALILGGTRNATVRMVTEGELLRLGKEEFLALIAASQAEMVSPAVARSMLDDGYRLLDVRYEEEYEDEHIEGSLLIPLSELRQRIHEVSPSERYLVLCKGGKRAEVATMLLKQQQIKAATIAGGIRDWPFEKVGGI